MRKNKHAVALGRSGGRATARKLTKPERIASAIHAALARWQQVRIARQSACQSDEKGENK